MQPMPKLRRAKGKRGIGGGGNAGLTAMPPMPGKSKSMDLTGIDESMIYGGGVRGMRANVAKIHGFGPMREIEPEIEKGVRNWITPMSRPNITKSSRDVRDVRYSGGWAINAMAPMLEQEARRINTLDWTAVIEWSE